MSRLPALRADLQLSPAPAALDGTPQWTLADPLRGRYFVLGADAMRLLRHWALGDPQRVLHAANHAASQPLLEDDLQQLLRFLREHELISPTDAEQRRSYPQRAQQARQSPWKKLLHQYLFFRIPLWRPDAFLNRTWPWLQRHGRWLLRFGLPMLLVLGVFLVARDWERFIASFPHLFSFGGILAFGLALIFAKLCHEFGHAYMAKRAGCRVQSMGLAFMVLMPLFYTDVSDAWRVSDRRARLLIGAGGVLAELLLAVLALLAWSLLPDGALRTAAFMLASATWITTLAVNLNPFMRFDGYFLLSDLWGMDNLQGRAFALCRWRLREVLFGYGAPPPEPLPRPLERRLLVWGFAAWLWRAALFLAIALAVYHLFFKLLGIVLMLVELVWFIGLPIGRELKEWWQRRGEAHAPRLVLSLAVAAAILLALLTPWRSQVEMPALLESARITAVHTALPARIVSLHVQDGQPVRAGDPLLTLESPDLDAQQAIARQEIHILQQQLRRQAARSETIGDVAVLEQNLAEALAHYRGLAEQRERLQLRATFAGTVRDLAPNLQPGRWVARELPLMKVVADQAQVRGYLAEEELTRLQVGAPGRFLADTTPLRPGLAVRLEEIDRTAASVIEQPSLASLHGGPVAARHNEHGQLQSVQAQYGVRLGLAEAGVAPTYPVRGIVVAEGHAQSLLGRAWRRVAALAVRESGF